MATAPVGQRPDSGPQEHLEGETSLGEFREVALTGGGGPVSLSKVIPRCGTSGVSIWGRDIGSDNSNVTKI